MKLVLIFPPLADPTQPYSSLPTLTAFLRPKNRGEVFQWDENIHFVRQLLTGECIRNVGAKIRSRLAELDATLSLSKDEQTEYSLLSSAFLKAPLVAAKIDAAVADLKDHAVFNDLNCLDRAKRLVQESMEILSCTCYPLRLGFSSSSHIDFAAPAELARWACDTQTNPFQNFLRKHTLPRLVDVSPTAVGISVTYRTQVLPAITLALLIKQHLTGTPVVLGGNMVSHWYDSIEECPEIFEWCNYLISFEGESALDALMMAIDGARPLNSVPNLAYVDRGRVKKNAVLIEDINRLPTPDYSGLPLDSYLSPRPVFLLSTSRGCYWSRCCFCSVSPSTRVRYRRRHPDLVHKDIVTLHKRHGAECISFADDCVAPPTLNSLAVKLKTEGPRISWQCEVRFEKALTEVLLRDIMEAGCRNLIFGLESYSPRVLGLMNKGICHGQIERILKACRSIGIAFNLQFFFGFPGETASEAKSTIAFVEKQMHGAASFSFGSFELQKGSMIETNPCSYGIQSVDRTRGPLAVKFEYAPIAQHATEMKTHLSRVMQERTRYHYLGISINAHTLILLHQFGIQAMADVYRAPDVESHRTPRGLMERHLVTCPNQNIGVFLHSPASSIDETQNDSEKREGNILVYNYDLDRAVEISKLGLWILQHFDGTATPSELVSLLEKEIGQLLPAEHLQATVQTVIDDFYKRGFVRELS